MKPMRPDEFIDSLYAGYNRWAAYTLWYALEENVIEGWKEQRDVAWQDQEDTGGRVEWESLISRWASWLHIDQERAEMWHSIVPMVIGGMRAQVLASE